MRKSKKSEIAVTIGLTLFFLIFLSPILIAFSASFRHVDDTSNYLKLFQYFCLDSYRLAFGKLNYFRSLKNSILITTSSVFLLLLFSSMAGYAVARLKGKLGSFFQIFFFLGLIVSAQMSIIPMYRIINGLGLSNTRVAPVCMYVTAALPFSIFLYTNFVKSGVPYTLEEAARIDGCSVFRTYFSVVLPLLKPAMATLVIMQAFQIWNDYLLASLYVSKKQLKTLTVAIQSLFSAQSSDYTTAMAAIVISVLPIAVLFLSLQKYFIKGMTVGAVKG